MRHYASGIGSIAYAIIFMCSEFSKCLGHSEGNGPELYITKVVKQLLRTIQGSLRIGHLWAIGSIVMNGPY